MMQPNIKIQDEMDNILVAPKGDIMSMGYGLCPQMLFRDHRISCQAKAIYGYFASFAGAGSVAFPSKTLMSAELGMSGDTLTKYLRELIAYGYIKASRKRNAKGRFTCNVYELCREPSIDESTWDRYAEKKAREIVRGSQKYARKKDREKEALAAAIQEVIAQPQIQPDEDPSTSNDLGIVENLGRDAETDAEPHPDFPGMDDPEKKNPRSQPGLENPGMENPGLENPGTKSNSDGNSNNSKQIRQENRGGGKTSGGECPAGAAPSHDPGAAADGQAAPCAETPNDPPTQERVTDERWSEGERGDFELLCSLSIKPVKDADRPEAARLWNRLRENCTAEAVHAAYRAYRQRYFAKNSEVRYAMKLVDWMRKPSGFEQDAAALRTEAEAERRERVLNAKRRAGDPGLKAALAEADERYRQLIESAEAAGLAGRLDERAHLIDEAERYYVRHRDDAALAWSAGAGRKGR